jgi:hypothetical protein
LETTGKTELSGWKITFPISKWKKSTEEIKKLSEEFRFLTEESGMP